MSWFRFQHFYRNRCGIILARVRHGQAAKCKPSPKAGIPVTVPVPFCQSRWSDGKLQYTSTFSDILVFVLIQSDLIQCRSNQHAHRACYDWNSLPIGNHRILPFLEICQSLSCQKFTKLGTNFWPPSSALDPGKVQRFTANLHWGCMNRECIWSAQEPLSFSNCPDTRRKFFGHKISFS